MKAITLANANVKKRRELDFYPTPPDVTHTLMHFLQLPKSLIWEPAAGKGAMVNVIRLYGHEVIASDIAGYEGNPGKDFLATHIEADAIITNPPFDRSVEFIRHALEQTPIVCMLLKSQYWHAQRRTELFYDVPPAYILPLNWRPDFLFDQRLPGEKSNPTMEVAWTVWIKVQTDTRYRVLQNSRFLL